MNRAKSGFTIIELMLAMAFVSALLLAVALTTIQIGRSYNRGLTMKDVNETGLDLANEIKNAINSSESFHVSGSDSKFIRQDWGGRLCVGRYSYIWNDGQYIEKNNQSQLNVYSNSSNIIRFVKISDPSASYCTDSSKDVDSTQATELLSKGQHNLTVHYFDISTSDSAYDSVTKQRLYNIEFVIGTNESGTLSYNSGNATCKLANENDADQQYCMINRFNFAARAGNISS